MPKRKYVPAYVELDYASPFGQHVSTLNMRTIATTGLSDSGTVEAWDGSTLSTQLMVEDMIDALQAAVPSTIAYTNYTIYRWPDPEADPQPIFTKAYTAVGTETGLTGQAKAVQVTIGFRTEAFGQARIVVLDRPVNGNFGSFVDPAGDFAGVIDEFTASDNAWTGVDGFRPAAYTNTSITLSKRLRRKYKMI